MQLPAGLSASFVNFFSSELHDFTCSFEHLQGTKENITLTNKCVHGINQQAQIITFLSARLN